MGTILPAYKNSVSGLLSPSNSTELIHKLYLFRYLMSQVNMTWRNYNSYAIFYITWLRESYYVFTAQLKFKVHIYKISQSR